MPPTKVCLDKTKFVRGLASALRFEGLVDFTAVINPVIAGLEAAIAKAEENGILLESHEKNSLLNSDEFFSINCAYGLIETDTSNRERVKFKLDKEGSEEYFKYVFKYILPNKYFDVFRECAKVFITKTNERMIKLYA
jgi:hypothetical protein